MAEIDWKNRSFYNSAQFQLGALRCLTTMSACAAAGIKVSAEKFRLWTKEMGLNRRTLKLQENCRRELFSMPMDSVLEYLTARNIPRQCHCHKLPLAVIPQIDDGTSLREKNIIVESAAKAYNMQFLCNLDMLNLLLSDMEFHREENSQLFNLRKKIVDLNEKIHKCTDKIAVFKYSEQLCRAETLLRALEINSLPPPPDFL